MHEVLRIPERVAMPGMPTDQLVLSDQAVGIEVELEGMKRPPAIEWWNKVEDGSLRNSGVEYIFAQPLAGNACVLAVRALDSTLGKRVSKPVLSERTSVHVHIDISQWPTSQFKLFCMLWVLLESVSFEYFDANRFSNPYCIPFMRSNDRLRALFLVLSYVGMNSRNADRHCIDRLKGWQKYSALHVGSAAIRGSLEVRLFPGTWKANELLKYINYLLAIVKFTKGRRTTAAGETAH